MPYIRKGYHPWNKGKKMTDEYKKNMSMSLIKAHKLKKWGHKKGQGYWLGKKRPDISGKNHYLYGKSREFMQGNKHWNWKGGITTKDRMERIKFRRQIQKQVFERDDYTCQICLQKGGQLQVDHIQSWVDYIELRFSMDNCRTLCMDCHYFITFGKKKPEDIIWGHNLQHVERMVL